MAGIDTVEMVRNTLKNKLFKLPRTRVAFCFSRGKGASTFTLQPALNKLENYKKRGRIKCESPP